MDFYRYIEEILQQCIDFKEIHNNPYDTSKHNGNAGKISILEKILADINKSDKQDTDSIDENNDDIYDQAEEELEEEARLEKLYKLKGSVGDGGDNFKDSVIFVQSLLNRHGASLGVDGDSGGKTIKAIKKFQKTKVGTETGLVEPVSDTFKALLSKPDKVVEGQEEIVTGLGVSGKLGNVIYNKGKYIISTPPDAEGAYPLVLLFSGKGQNASSLMKYVPDIYFLKAIMVFSPPKETYSNAAAAFQPLLTDNNLSVASVSICGFSLGGQAAYNSYADATKAVGLIDPTTYYKNLNQIDSKAVLSCNPNIWGFSAKKPGKKDYLVKHCLEDAVKIANDKGGHGEIRKIPHGKFPQFFLSKFMSKLI
jgi:peptidoglycan hydrolase-like protein with peptidoglycan-binding domain